MISANFKQSGNLPTCSDLLIQFFKFSKTKADSLSKRNGISPALALLFYTILFYTMYILY